MRNPKVELSRRRSLSDPLAVALKPPPNESPIQREQRLQAENDAKKISDNIDDMIRRERAERKRERADSVNILLLGQSESGKSTTLKRKCSAALYKSAPRFWSTTSKSFGLAIFQALKVRAFHSRLE